MLAALPTLSELAIPVGLTATSYIAHDYLEEKPKQTGGYCRNSRPKKKQTGGQKGGNPFLIKAASDLI
ncbi:MAG TPA: hypothetical protein VGW78_06695, partial [Candidatus Babeliales bacterium]|nr:hypothetical protein [Candidatus Babeliales bacterium]